MQENFKIVGINKIFNKKENKENYYIVLYSQYEYLVRVYIDKQHYEMLLKLDSLDKYDLSKHLTKRYYNYKFYYSIVD